MFRPAELPQDVRVLFGAWASEARCRSRGASTP